MLFRKKNNDSAAPEGAEAAVLLSKRRMTLTILECAVVLLVLGLALSAYLSNAWYANNREVDANDNSITSASATTSLFISPGTTVDNNYYTARSVSWTDANLFPISTSDCANWWYVSAFTPVEAANGMYTAQASAYTKATAAETESATYTGSFTATYDNTLDGDGKVAYVVSKYMLYTNNESLDVWLDPTNPIVVSYATNNVTAKQLLNALRIGVKVGGTLKFIYAPVAESITDGTGNSAVTYAANTYFAVTDEDTVGTCSAVITDLSAYKATASGNTSDPYSAGTGTGATKLCTTTPDGVQVEIYVWLEGTDAQAMLGKSDEDLKGINITVNYVGVTPTPTANP